MKARLLTAAAAFALGAVPSAAHASFVTVNFGLSAEHYLPTGAACPVTVALGADGLAVLEAARTAGCIVSYQTVTYPTFGTFVTCIDEVCGTPVTGTVGTYWNMYENGVSTSYGVDGFSASSGDDLTFAYKAYCFESVCPPDLEG